MGLLKSGSDSISSQDEIGRKSGIGANVKLSEYAGMDCDCDCDCD
jgi:hypothetical protein